MSDWLLWFTSMENSKLTWVLLLRTIGFITLIYTASVFWDIAFVYLQLFFGLTPMTRSALFLEMTGWIIGLGGIVLVVTRFTTWVPTRSQLSYWVGLAVGVGISALMMLRLFREFL
jgi:hypothetical protein